MPKKAKLLIIGSVTYSVATYDDGIRERFGGGVAYGGRTAGILGIPAKVITVGAEDIGPGVEEIRSYGIDVMRIPRNSSNNFYNDYRGERRQLRMKDHIKRPLCKEDLANQQDCDAVIFFPGFHEISAETVEIFKGKTIFLDVGGLTRAFGEKDKEGYYLIDQVDWDTIDEFRNKVDILKVSQDDLEGMKFDPSIKNEDEKIQCLAENGFPIVLFTKGCEGIILARKGLSLEEIPTFKVHGDSGGAGDTFSVGFMAEYLENKDPIRATAFGSACASFKISGEDYDYGKAKLGAEKILEKAGV